MSVLAQPLNKGMILKGRTHGLRWKNIGLGDTKTKKGRGLAPRKCLLTKLIDIYSVLQILNSRWVSSSRDVVALRTCLLNPKTCAEFKTFVALKGDTFENDVDFWLEVQKFKVGVSRDLFSKNNKKRKPKVPDR